MEETPFNGPLEDMFATLTRTPGGHLTKAPRVASNNRWRRRIRCDNALRGGHAVRVRAPGSTTPPRDVATVDAHTVDAGARDAPGARPDVALDEDRRDLRPREAVSGQTPGTRRRGGARDLCLWAHEGAPPPANDECTSPTAITLSSGKGTPGGRPRRERQRDARALRLHRRLDQGS